MAGGSRCRPPAVVEVEVASQVPPSGRRARNAVPRTRDSRRADARSPPCHSPACRRGSARGRCSRGTRSLRRPAGRTGRARWRRVRGCPRGHDPPSRGGLHEGPSSRAPMVSSVGRVMDLLTTRVPCSRVCSARRCWRPEFKLTCRTSSKLVEEGPVMEAPELSSVVPPWRHRDRGFPRRCRWVRCR